MDEDEYIDEEPGEQSESRHDILEGLKEKEAKSKTAHLLPFQYKKGQSGNPSGRPPGISLKEYARLKFRTMTDDEREEFFHGMNKIDLFKMAEGNPDTKTDITTAGEKLPSQSDIDLDSLATKMAEKLKEEKI